MPAQIAHAEEGQLPGGIIIYGRGFGHGRGLSQYGAYGWATVHGWSWEQILDFYYGGATGNSRSNLEAPNQEMTTWLSAMNNKQTGVVQTRARCAYSKTPTKVADLPAWSRAKNLAHNVSIKFGALESANVSTNQTHRKQQASRLSASSTKLHPLSPTRAKTVALQR
ncbi:MAG: hypothetical protein ACKO1E_05005 [Acidimicrobiaceae bacterium]